MTTPAYDILALGNAIVDVLAHVSDDVLAQAGVPKGAMTLVDEERAEAAYMLMTRPVTLSGGSAANTAAGVALLGGKAAFVGKVKRDLFGEAFERGMKDIGVTFRTPPASHGPGTGRCHIMVTPDGERTMQTHLGIAPQLEIEDIDAALVADAAILYIEGYLWDAPNTKSAIRHAIAIAKKHGRRVAFTLSDPFCVRRHRTEFLHLLLGEIDILFANEHEITALFETDDFDDAAHKVKEACAVAALTRSARGSVIVTPHATLEIAPEPVARVVDATGAGDLYAAGFLYGLTHGLGLPECGALAGKCAARIIQQFGARPEGRLDGLLG